MRNNALITPKVLIWARERLDLSLKEASEYLKIKPEMLKIWEDGSKYPTIQQAKKIARKYKIPYVFFFLPEPPKNIKLPKNKDYRTFSNQPIKTFSIELKTLLFDIMQRREAMIQLNQELSIDIPSFSYFFNIETMDEKEIAETVRAILKIRQNFKTMTEYEAFNFFRNAIESIGIFVFQAADIEPSEMRGISVLEEAFPIIVLNRKDAVRARIFTLIHEFVHLITKTAGICDNNGMSELSSIDIELKCNHIAAQALVPEDLLKTNQIYSLLLDNWNDDHVRNLGNEFAVSREVILGRLLTFKDINFDFYKRRMEQYSIEYYQNKNKQKSDKNGFLAQSIDKETQFGKTYIKTVLTAYNQEIITARDAIQYFDGLRLKHFEKLESWCFA
jgi:Zn-dependent peptidase ImmA (M78 family)